MANRREFKKYVDALSSSLYYEMMISYYNVEDIDKEKVTKAIGKVLGAMETAKIHSNTIFDKGRKSFENSKDYIAAKQVFYKKLFNKITTDFTNEIDAALKLFNSAIPEKIKEENKQFA